jgi:hypothetical protein
MTNRGTDAAQRGAACPIPARRAASRLAGALLCLLAPCLLGPAAHAYGPLGHRIAGLAAEPLLCGRARAEIRSLAGDVGLDELGLWADRVRSYPEHADSAPWHYMNIADGASLAEYVSPPEGDVLGAIARFSGIVADIRAARAQRRDALRFLVHFVVDLHQPLHVGRAEDRGGNAVELVYQGEATNLHRFWDTQAIALDGLAVDAYARALFARAGIDAGGAASEIGTPRSWARESLALRPDVYSLNRRGRIDDAYRRRAERITERRLAAAALRLAGTLNRLLC